MVRCARHPGGIILVGVLNSLARINAKRKAAGAPLYADARFFSPSEVQTMLAPHGEMRVAVAAFVSPVVATLPLARLTDSVARLLHSQHGAFIVGKVVL